MSLLTIIQQSCRLLSLPVPTEVVNSTDVIVQQLYALANEEGHSLSTSHDWQKLTREQTFTTVGAAVQPDAVPADWQRFIPNSFFDRTIMRPVLGPITPQQWQAYKAFPAAQTIYLCFRERDNEFLLTSGGASVPPVGHTIAYEYVSKDWAYTASDVPIQEFTADTDTPYLSERLFVLGIRWRFLKSKGLDYAQDFDTYERQLQIEQGREQGATALSIAPRRGARFLGTPSVVIGTSFQVADTDYAAIFEAELN